MLVQPVFKLFFAEHAKRYPKYEWLPATTFSGPVLIYPSVANVHYKYIPRCFGGLVGVVSLAVFV